MSVSDDYYDKLGDLVEQRPIGRAHQSEWQPIETAPKDGTPILVHAATLGPAPFAITWWALGLLSGRQSQVTRAPLVEDFWTNGKGAKMDGIPSHWMLLPLPPTT